MAIKSYEDRASQTSNAIIRKLLQIMVEKRSNLCVAVDVVTTTALLDIVSKIGPYICLLKLHINTLEDFSMALISKLKTLAAQYNFLLFEDSKFGDIGNTVALQYARGVYRIAEWADIVTVHSMPGPGIITSLKSVAAKVNEPRGILLIAEMSTAGNLFTPDIANRTIDMAEAERDFVVGFISQERPARMTDEFLVMTPGVSLSAKGDAAGQQYKSPKDAIVKGADLVIVGRGIYEADKVESTAKAYQEAGWNAYLEVLANN